MGNVIIYIQILLFNSSFWRWKVSQNKAKQRCYLIKGQTGPHYTWKSLFDKIHSEDLKSRTDDTYRFAVGSWDWCNEISSQHFDSVGGAADWTRTEGVSCGPTRSVLWTKKECPVGQQGVSCGPTRSVLWANKECPVSQQASSSCPTWWRLDGVCSVSATNSSLWSGLATLGKEQEWKGKIN